MESFTLRCCNCDIYFLANLEHTVLCPQCTSPKPETTMEQIEFHIMKSVNVVLYNVRNQVSSFDKGLTNEDILNLS